MDFHVGEYVQTRDGRTGYIEDVLLWTAIKCVFYLKDEVLREKFKKIGVCDFESPSRKIEPIKLDDELIGIVEVLLYEKVNELTESLNKFNEQLAKERKK